MTEIISRLYGTSQAAQAAVDALKEYGIAASGIFVVGPPEKAPASDAARTAALDALAEEMMKGWVLKYKAKIYAEEVLAGGTLVTVHANFGYATAATTLLDEAGPITSSVADPPRTYIGWDEAAPLSSALQFPPLSDSRSSFSRFFSMQILVSPHFSLSRALGLPETTKSSTQSSTFGAPLLSKDPAPLSSLLRLPTLL